MRSRRLQASSTADARRQARCRQRASSTNSFRSPRSVCCPVSGRYGIGSGRSAFALGSPSVISATMDTISSPPPHSISKRTMCRPTRLPYRGRLKWLGELSEDYAPLLHRGIGGGMYTRKAHETREASRPATTAGASRTAHNPLLATRGPPRPALLRYVGLRDAGLGSVRGVILEREKGSHLDAI